MARAKATLKLSASLFFLNGLENLSYSFASLAVREPLPNDKNRPVQLQQWADDLRFRLIKCPVTVSNHNGRPGFFIPEADLGKVSGPIKVSNVTGQIYHIEPTGETVTIDPTAANGFERRLIEDMLERAFTAAFLKQKSVFWRDGWTRFFRMTAENERRTHDELLAYRGLEFSIVLLGDGIPHLAADIVTRYVARHSLAEALGDQRKMRSLKQHLDIDIPFDRRPTFLRDNGPLKITCRFFGNTDKTVSEFIVNEELGTIYDYYQKRYRQLGLAPDSPAVFVQDSKNKASIAAPAARLFPVFTTEHRGVRECSVKPQIDPVERVKLIRAFLTDLGTIAYNRQHVTVSKNLSVVERTVFVPPRLEYGVGQLLDPFKDVKPNPERPSFDTAVKRYSGAKLSTLYTSGPFHNEPLPDVVFFHPDTLDRERRKQLLDRLNNELVKQSRQELNIVKFEPYPTGGVERGGSSLLERARSLQAEGDRRLALIMLWDGFDRHVYPRLKETLDTWPSQFMREDKLRRISQGQIKSLALAVLTEVGVQPWVLADDLHFDLHLGIDLLHGQVAYHFFYGKGGRRVHLQLGQASKKGRMKEAIESDELRAQLKTFFKKVQSEGYSVRSLLIHRDGRWWPSEQVALGTAVESLWDEGLLPEDFRCAVAEIRKSHLPVRLFTTAQVGRKQHLNNPIFGSYRVLDARRVVLATTRRTRDWRGRTAGTLLMELSQVLGDVNVVDVAEDIYRFTHLNYSEPEVEISVPVTIRWNDDRLRRTLRPDGGRSTVRAEQSGKSRPAFKNTLRDP